MWGGLFAHGDRNARTAANLDFKKRCAEARVLPYFVPIGGFMLTPRYDDDPELLAAAVKEMSHCALETARAMGWAPSALLPLSAPPSPSPAAPAQSFKGPEGKMLAKLNENTLQNICKDLDVTASGNKDELVTRICETL